MLPPCANDDDVRDLFEASGFKVFVSLLPLSNPSLTLPRQQVVMVFSSMYAHNIGRAYVILESEHVAKAAVHHLNGAILFDRRVRLESNLQDLTRDTNRVSVSWGWTASEDPCELNAKLREPHLQPPKDIFRPVREGRRVAVDMPENTCRLPNELYSLFHNYNVERMGKKVLYKRKDGTSRTAVMIDFSTREEAEIAVKVYNKSLFKGERILVNKYQIPLKYLGGTSWDGGRRGGHYSGRDQGNAAGTNFERVSCHIQPSLSSMPCPS